MKQAQNARKQRARSSSRKGGSNNKSGAPGNSRSEMRVRGNPKQLLEKYKNQAREAKQAGDHVTAEYYYQFADHYQRVCNELRGPNEPAWTEEDDMNEDVVYHNDADGNVADADEQQAAEGEQSSRNRRGRNNNRRPQGRNGGDEQPRVRPESQEQPVEVHPELDLQGTLAPEGEEKPRRRSPARRRAPRVRKDEGAEGAPEVAVEPAQGGEAA